MTTILIAFLLTLCLISKLFGISIFKKYNPPNLPNGKMGWPLIGETISFLKSHKSNTLGLYLDQHCSKFGKVFKSNLFGSPTIVSCDLELNMFILQNEETLFQSSYPKPVHDILGKLSMMLVSGELHKKLRNVAVSFIGGSKFKIDFIHCVDKYSIALMDSWRTKRKVFFYKEAKEFTFYLMLKNLVNIEPTDPIATKVLQHFLTFMKGFVSIPLYIPGTSYANAVKARKRISSALKDIIIKRRETRSTIVGDFLDQILTKVEINDDERVSILLDLLLAGYETTSGLLTLVIYFLCQSPRALQELQEEHEALSKRKNGAPLDWEDYKKMVFTSMVICEALRCGNLVKFVHRKSLKDVKFKDYLIPVGWQVLPILLATHLDPVLHENPSEFDPWRWNNPATIRKMTPFGGGLRICPGAELGKMEIAFFLHHFVLNYRWKMVEADDPMSCPYLDFKRGLLLEIEPIRNNSLGMQNPDLPIFEKNT